VTSHTQRTLEGRVAFGAGPWQHFGWGSNDFAGDRYAMFSTHNQSTDLYARVNSGSGEQQVNLGLIPIGLHDYRIVWQAENATTDRVEFYIDGIQVAASISPVATFPPSTMYVYASNNGGTAATLQVDWLRVLPTIATTATYESCAKDAGGPQTGEP
jgi:hypothetical protein